MVTDPDSGEAKSHLNGVYLSLGIMIICAFMGNFTQTQLNTALPQVVDDFHISVTMGQWLTSVFMLTLGIMVPMTAFLTRRFTTRQIVIVSMGVFLAGSLLAYCSPNFGLLIIGRILEAAGTGILLPATQIIIFSEIPLSRRGFMMGIVGFILSVAPAVGPTLGGWQTDKFGWRSIFLTLAVLGAVLIIVAAFFLKNYGTLKKTSIDILSIILSTVGFGGALFGFTNIESHGLLEPVVWMPMLIGIASLIWFIHRQLTMKNPLLNLRVLKNKKFSTGMVIVSLNFFAFSAFAVLLPIYLQNDRGISATISGLTMLPGAIASAITGLVAGRIMDRKGARTLTVVGAFLMFAGSAMMIPLTMDMSVAYITFAQFVRMAGIGMVMTTMNTWSMNALEPQQVSDGTGVSNTFRQCMGAIGAPVIVVIMESIQRMLHNQGMNLANAGVTGTKWAIVFSTVAYCVMLIIVLVGVHDSKPKVREVAV